MKVGDYVVANLLDGHDEKGVFRLDKVEWDNVYSSHRLWGICVSQPDTRCLSGPITAATVHRVFETQQAALAWLEAVQGTKKMPDTPIHSAPVEFNEPQLEQDPILRFFHYSHLPPQLAAVSAPFCHLAHRMVTELPRNPERTVALRKLLESKDCAVRTLVGATK